MPHHVAVILLAAGRSQRMGRSKPLLPLGDKPVIRHCLDTIEAVDLKEIIVVLGHGAEEIENVIGNRSVTLVRNPDPDSDMAGSVRVGLQKVSRAASAVLVFLADHPLVSSDTLDRMIDLSNSEPGFITIPTYLGKKGHPTLFPLQLIKELFEVPTLRHVIQQNQSRLRLVEVPDQGVVLDMDTPEDYRNILNLRKMC